MKSNLPLRVDQNTTLVDVKYDRTHSTYWYVIDKPGQFDAQETARQVKIGVCTNAENSSTMKNEGFSYEYHYRTKDGLALADFKINARSVALVLKGANWGSHRTFSISGRLATSGKSFTAGFEIG